MAALAFLAWLVKAGVVVNFISETVMVGFKAGVALYLASTQLPKLFGFKGAHGDFWERSGHFFSHLGETNLRCPDGRCQRARAAGAREAFPQE